MEQIDVDYAAPGVKPVPGPWHLLPGRYIDSGHPAVREFANRTTQGAADARESAVRLFYAVRDGWRYDPFTLRLDADHFKASSVLELTSSYCIPKAILLAAAAARAVGIPSAIGLSDVVNHLTTPRLRERLGGKDLFLHHGYAVLCIDGRWVKAAPAFNIELCDRFHVRPTEFDGRSDAIFQPYDALDRRHMEYVKDHGIWSDFPFERVTADLRAFYPPAAFGEEAGRFEDGAAQA